MFNIKTLGVVSVLALAPLAGHAATVTIDTFATTQSVITPQGPGFPATSTVAASEAVGGSRTITATGNGSAFPTLVTSVNVGGGSGSISNANQVTGTGLFEWSAGGADFTDGGLNDTFVLQINSVDLNVSFDLDIDGASATSAFNQMTGAVEFAFADFGDLSNVSDISLLVSGPEAFDASFSFFGAEDLMTNTVAAVPLPASGMMLGAMLMGAGVVARRRR